MMDNENFRRIYEANYRLAFKIAFDIIKDADFAEDICQDIFMKMYQNFQEADENLIRAWVVLNAKRRAIDYYRRVSTLREVGDYTDNLVRTESNYGLPETVITQRQVKELRTKVLSKLKAKNPLWCELMERVVIMDENPEAVAEDCGITIGHLRTMLHRARLWIRKEFGNEYKDLK